MQWDEARNKIATRLSPNDAQYRCPIVSYNKIKLLLYNIHLCYLKIINRIETEQIDAKKLAIVCYQYDIMTARKKKTVDEGNDGW